ncbi:MAG TPA: CHASE domain-containing protein [Candidatus Paceibacterota bacterium]|nr:CHASE domain-containing protein [Verrucomicrobiota bacterium]HRY51709.1 CHASE domain-containing protein [Candidatus Paceibacterota bacterium]
MSPQEKGLSLDPASEAISKRTFSDRASFFTQPVAWVVLGISLAASVGGWILACRHADLEARRRFDEEVNRITTALTERMLIYQDVLHGAVGLYASSYSVERAEWRAYLESVGIEKRFPGVDGVGFAANVPRDKLEEFLRITRQDNAPDFSAQEPGTNQQLIIVKYLEPEQRHGAWLGVDIGRDPEQRAGAEQARDTGKTIITGTMTGLRDDRGAQGGFLMLLPVYRHGAPTATVEDRRAGIEGWVFSRFITANLMRGMLEGQDSILHFQVNDPQGTGIDKIIFANIPTPVGRESRFTSALPLPLGGRSWLLKFSTTPAFEKAVVSRAPVLVGIAGGFISLLLYAIACSLSSTRIRALKIASDMTATLRGTNRRLEREIGVRQRTEQGLRDSETLYHSLVESLPMQIFRKDLEGRFTFANQRFCSELGKPLAEILGKTDADFQPSDMAERQRNEDRRVLETGATIENIREIPQPAGLPRFLQEIKTVMRDGAGNVIGLLGIWWDVTDQHRAEQALEQERFLMNMLIDHVPDRIYFKDAQSRFLRINRALARLFHLADPAEAVGKSDFDYFAHEHAQQAFEDEQRIIRSGQPVIGLVEKESLPDGNVRWALTTKMPLRDKAGCIAGTFGISRDFTDLKQTEEALRQAKEAAEDANRAKSQFLASMSHELRTPLNSVIGFANILLKNKSGNLTSTELNFLERIAANGQHLLGLINEVLDLSKIEARKVEIQRSPVALEVLVRNTVAQEEGLVRDKPIRLLADLPANMAPLMTDADKLKQVLINLIGNALKFTESGSVTVRVKTDPATREPVQLDVVDTGIGIPHDKLRVIFEAFQQAEAGTARKYGGTGLGLTISQALCRLMGYRIEVTSEPGKGSTFSVYFNGTAQEPKDRPLAVHPVKPSLALEPPAEFRRKLVLVIDDELDSRTLLEHMIEELGCRVITAPTGETGLRMAREFRPQLITVDLMMPRVDGWEVVRLIKADRQLREIPVVVVSMVAGESRGRILGAVDVLQKPVSHEDLLDVLQRNLLHRKSRILVVDDDADARRLLVSQLEDVACEIRVAGNGREALAAIETQAPDLILLDLIMPVMDGISFLNALRAEPRFGSVAVVVITGKELTLAEIASLRSQACEVLPKAEVFASDLKSLMAGLLNPPKLEFTEKSR